MASNFIALPTGVAAPYTVASYDCYNGLSALNDAYGNYAGYWAQLNGMNPAYVQQRMGQQQAAAMANPYVPAPIIEKPNDPVCWLRRRVEEMCWQADG